MRLLADNKDLNPRSASPLSCTVFSPFLTEDVTPDMRGGKPNYVSAAGQLARMMHGTDMGVMCALRKAQAPSTADRPDMNILLQPPGCWTHL